MTAPDPYPASDFDEWAGAYDADILAYSAFPFAGYTPVLETVLESASPTPGMSVLDIGTGTGNLAALFAAWGCEVWCSDYSEPMLARIVSAYVFHHFELDEKVRLSRRLIQHRLAPNGILVIADLSFPDRKQMDAFAASIGDLWGEEEPYWPADEALKSLAAAGIKARYLQVSPCAGVYSMPGALKGVARC